MTKKLIINADDCNLTAGVTRGILFAHDEGIVTSTTVLINLPLEEKTVREIKKRKKLGVGLHLNVTLKRPVSRSAQVRSLLKPDGQFRRPADYLEKMPKTKELIREYNAQVTLFRKCFDQKPDHLDTHHHLHDSPLFFQALSSVARKWKLPIRRSRIFQIEEHAQLTEGLQTTGYLFGNLEARYSWNEPSFLGIAENLQEGSSEIACHPGFCDNQLREISSLREARERELQLFSSLGLRREIVNFGVELIRFPEI